MRMLFTVFLLHFATSLSKATTQHVAESSSSISAKHPSRKSHGKTIQQLIGGHVLFNRESVRTLGNNNVKQSNNSAVTVIKKQNKKNSETINQTSGLPLVTASASYGKIGKEATNSPKREESKKTLSDQVAEGKYGLIHKELFKTKPKRPGVLSYKLNSDVPKDDSISYGGLKNEEIWLAEDYLLVIKGGFVNKNGNTLKWNPIDDYNAPRRQVKLPSNPKVPPPFPVQLTDNGPIQFIGNNKLPSYNPFTNQTVFLFSNEGVPHIKADDLNKKSTTPWNGKDNTSAKFNGYQYPPPAPLPLNEKNQTFSNPFLNLPPLSISGSIDEQNNTSIDEDDPSLYYPPPYSFEYKNNYNNPVSPGPLVPGIILPPPPYFFASLENENNTALPVAAKSQINSTTIKSKPITIETPNYKIEIEKVNVEKFSENNEIVSTRRPVSQFAHAITTQKSSRIKKPPRVRTQLHKVNTHVADPLISLNPVNFTGTPIYFEYFDARAPMLEPFHDYSVTTPKSYLSTLSTEDFDQKTTTENPLSKSPLNQKQHPSETFLPIEGTGIYVEHDLRNDRYKTLQEFNREIATIKQTLRLYENSLSRREPKAQRPFYNFAFDYRHSSSVQPVERPFNEHQYSLTSQPQQSFQRVYKPDHDKYSYKDYSANVGTTSANPLDYISFSSAKPFYFVHPNWYSVDNVRIHEIPKPLVYNNGASGYNNKLSIAGKPIYQANVSRKKNQNESNQPQRYNPSIPNKSTFSYRNQQQNNEGHLFKDTLVNFKHPIPVIDPDSELLPTNRNRAKPKFQYQLPSDRAHIFFITPQELKYS